MCALHSNSLFNSSTSSACSVHADPSLYLRYKLCGHQLWHSRDTPSCSTRKQIRQRDAMPSYWTREAQHKHTSNLNTLKGRITKQLTGSSTKQTKNKKRKKTLKKGNKRRNKIKNEAHTMEGKRRGNPPSTRAQTDTQRGNKRDNRYIYRDSRSTPFYRMRYCCTT